MRVIDIARKTQLSPETVRHYTRLGLLHPSRDPHSGYKVSTITMSPSCASSAMRARWA